jgi:dipeptidase D
MSNPFEGLEPRLLWQHFDAIRAVPRPSGKEERIRAHLLEWAGSRRLDARTDAIGNVVVKVPATPGHEKAPAVVLQGHLDMVCEKNEEVVFDWASDAIRVRRDGDWIATEGTTLGADNGIGLAAALAVAEDPGAVHGPLEILATVDEETGLHGAYGLDASLLEGRLLLNLDSEEDGVLFVGCAGGGDSHLTLKPEHGVRPSGRAPFTVTVKGLLGGHSGLNIVENRGNAIKLTVGVLQAYRAAGVAFSLASINGGDKHNAIPRECRAVILAATGEPARLKSLAADCATGFVAEFGGLEKGLSVAVAEGGDVAGTVLTADATGLTLDLLNALPHGVTAMSRDLAGLVETSTNLARVRTENGAVSVLCSTRSSVASALEALRDRIRAVATLSGAHVEHKPAYPGWQPDMESPLLATCRGVYQRLSGNPPHITAIHAGLECGIIGERVGGMRMISFGPDIKGAHSPDERVSTPSTARFYAYLLAVLAELA